MLLLRDDAMLKVMFMFMVPEVFNNKAATAAGETDEDKEK